MNFIAPNSLYSVKLDAVNNTVVVGGLGRLDTVIVNRIVDIASGAELYGEVSGKKGTVTKDWAFNELVISIENAGSYNDADIRVVLQVDETQLGIDAIAKLKETASEVTIPGQVTVVGRMRGPVSDSFTRPADTTAYAAGDAIQNSTSSPATRQFANLTTGAGSGYLTIVAVVRNTTPTPRLRVHLFSSNPTVRANDNAAFSVNSADEAAYLGYVDLDALNSGVAQGTTARPVVLTGTNLFYQVQTLDAFTPASGTQYLFKATLDSNV